MAIVKENQNLTIEFLYQSSDDPSPRIWIRFHYTEIGATISLSDNRQDWFPFPADLFSEATDYLRSHHNLLGGKELVAQVFEKPNTPLPDRKDHATKLGSIQRPESSSGATLPLPEIEGQVDEKDMQPEYQPPLDIADVQPVQSLSALGAGDIQNSQQPSASQQPQKVEEPIGRPVHRTDPDRVKGMSDEELLQTGNQVRGFNEGRGIKRTG